MEEELFQVMSGAVAVFDEQGVSLAGGHSAEGVELSVGFAAFAGGGERLLAKGGLQVGDRLILTKPIGTGVVLAGAMRGKTAGPDLIEVMDAMDVSSAAAARTIAEHGATACTDVTGFGLAGHLSEMTRASSVGAVLHLESIPFFPAAVELMRTGIESSLQPNNQQALDEFATEGCGRDGPEFRLLADPQTAGGLLAGVPASAAEACVNVLRSSGYARAAAIGTVEDGLLTIRMRGTRRRVAWTLKFVTNPACRASCDRRPMTMTKRGAGIQAPGEATYGHSLAAGSLARKCSTRPSGHLRVIVSSASM